MLDIYICGYWDDGKHEFKEAMNCGKQITIYSGAEGHQWIKYFIGSDFEFMLTSSKRRIDEVIIPAIKSCSNSSTILNIVDFCVGCQDVKNAVDKNSIIGDVCWNGISLRTGKRI